MLLPLTLFLVVSHVMSEPITGIETREDVINLIETVEHRNITAVQVKLRQLRAVNMEKIKDEPKISENSQNRMGPFVNHVYQVQEEGDTLFEVNRRRDLQDLTYQGDILLTEEQIDQKLADSELDTNTRSRRQAYRTRQYPSTLWPRKTVYYEFHKTATPAIRAAFKGALKVWQSNTCINFVENNKAVNRILVFKGDGCYSYVGKIGGVQSLSLGAGCQSVGTAAHEIGHALGFFHEQSRHDRNKFITVKYANIERGWADQFDKESSATNYNYGITYDYGGIMHYDGFSASGNGRPTMIARIGAYQSTMGSDIVSFYDILMMNTHYRCRAKCTRFNSAKCLNGGFPHPRNCRRCICPAGFAGRVCGARPPGCGAVLHATRHFKSLRSTVGNGKSVAKPDFVNCNYWIKAPPGKRVEIKIKTLKTIDIGGCIYGGIEIKNQPDKRRTGLRYCSSLDRNRVIHSTSPLLPIIVFNRFQNTIVELSYRIRQS